MVNYWYVDMYTRIGLTFTMVLQDAKHHIVGKFYIHKFLRCFKGIPKWIFCDFKACMTKAVLVNTQNAS